MKIIIGWLYPDLMSTYGDKGNVYCLKRRLLWRGIDVEILPIETETLISDIKKVNLFVGGGAQDRQQEIVMRDLKGIKGELIKEMIENETPGIFTCGAPQLLGKYYEPMLGQKIEGLGIFDMVSKHPGIDSPRCIGNIVIEMCDFVNNEYKNNNNYNNLRYLVGFENHGGRTFLGKNLRPLGKVISGFGNNGEDQTEGAIYKNAFATYLHGPVLPKNPYFTDLLLCLALEKKYGEKIQLKNIDDSLEIKANVVMVERIIGRNTQNR